jgi:3-oxoadipate enol-lactonase
MTLHANPPPADIAGHGADRYFKHDGASLRYRDEGLGPAVLLLHGWTLDLEMWESQAQCLHDRFRVVRYDRRGFGLSSGRPSLLADVEDMEALCRHLAIGRVAVLGMSQGARAALGFALATQQRIACLILDGPPDCLDAAGAAEEELPLEQYRALIRTQGVSAFRRQWREHPLVKLRTGDQHQRELVDAMIARYPANDLLESPTITAPALDAARLARLERLGTPLLVITGEHDALQRTEIANGLASKLPSAQRAVISAAGHLANLDNPSQYNAVVGAFLERHALAPT